MRCEICGIETRETYEDEGIFDDSLPSEDTFIYVEEYDGCVCQDCYKNNCN